ncbi:hypothetical protein [Streptacidiphilus albus]|uniref:hypothetical protein n=1 Tax=Streptacidiphilus albus TaxID=105425 RepID=UPI00054B078A|nr:hypothetical protein [Streptacidiphilus albus]
MDPLGQIASRFPLVARTRPACIPLEQRVAHLCDLAEAARRDSDPAAACAVHNLAALLASDCALPDLARQWCHRQADVLLRAHPLGAQDARHALEPLVNLARLHIRDGQGERAADLIDTLYEAVSTRTDTTIDGITVPASHLTATEEDHCDVRGWLWAVMLATGARALALCGRWDQARTRLLAHRGIGNRMLDGRQVDVIAHAVAGDTRGALTLLETTAPGEPWEQTVTACLTLLCRSEDMNPRPLLDRYLALDTSAPGLAVFHARLALAIFDLAETRDPAGARRIATALASLAATTRDGYAARDLLQHRRCSALLAESQRQDLSALVDACALGSRSIPAGLGTQIATALDSSERVIEQR